MIWLADAGSIISREGQEGASSVRNVAFWHRLRRRFFVVDFHLAAPVSHFKLLNAGKNLLCDRR